MSGRQHLHRADRAPVVPGYVTGRLLGFGGSGEVWAAVEETTGERVALKLLDVRRDRSAVLRECMVMQRIDHPHVVRLRAVVELGGSGSEPVDEVRRALSPTDPVTPEATVVLVLDHAPGGSLAALVGARGALDPEEVVTVASPLASALADLHARGLVHGDVSPANVLFAGDGRPLLSDLGVATTVGLDDTGASSGTPGYTDPAVLAGAAPTPAADVYGLCAVAWFALTGRPPHEAVDRPPLVSLVPEAPPALVAAIDRGLDPEPHRRPTGSELAVAVYDAAAAAPVRLVPTDPGAAAAEVVTHRLRRSAPVDPARRPATASGRGRRRVMLALGVLVASVVFGAAAYVVLDARSAPAGPPQARSEGPAEPSASASTAPVVPAGAGTPAPATVAGALSAPDWVPSPALLVALRGDEPADAVPALADLRAQAFSTGDQAPLLLANAAGSASLDSDRSVLASLDEAGVVLDGLTFDVVSADVVERSADTAVVRVGVVTGEHRRTRVSDGHVLAVRPASEVVRSTLHLGRTDGMWRVVEVS